MAEQSKTPIHNQGFAGWNPQGTNIERLMDNAAYTSAHPDDTLVLVGPSRFVDVTPENLKAVGLLQTMTVSQQRQVTPAMAIGSSRMYMLPMKAQTSFSIERLFCKGRNLQRALLRGISAVGDNEVHGVLNPLENAHAAGNPGMVFNMDSELGLIPFGMAVMFRNKSGQDIGSFYLESCMFQSYQIGISAGQNTIVEGIQGVCDRINPITLSTNYTGTFFNPTGGDNAFSVSSTATDYEMKSVIK
jgi:hypothetical protein